MPSTLSLMAIDNIDPRMGPMQGLHPKAKATPIRKGNKELLFHLSKFIFFSKLKALILINPIKKSPRNIISKPDMKFSCFLNSNKISLKKSMEAPIVMKINEKPDMNNIIERKFLILFCLFEFNRSVYDCPIMYDIKPGTIGNTHGDKKLNTPAKKAIVKGISEAINKV